MARLRYQLAAVVDDSLMRIGEVVRGEDLLESTALQLMLYDALGYEPPAFAHVPLWLDDDGERLAKRSGSPGLQQLRDSGATAEDVVGMLAASCGLAEPGTRCAAHELLHGFSREMFRQVRNVRP